MVLLKADFEKNKNRRGFEGKTGFDYLEVDYDIAPVGTDVLSYGFSLRVGVLVDCVVPIVNGLVLVG